MFRTTAGLLALGAILVASRASLGQGDASYTVTIKKVEVKKTQKNGDAWDVNNGAPDLRVIIRNATSSKEKAFESKEKKDVCGRLRRADHGQVPRGRQARDRGG
jgi:hypothetical protein